MTTYLYNFERDWFGDRDRVGFWDVHRNRAIDVYVVFDVDNPFDGVWVAHNNRHFDWNVNLNDSTKKMHIIIMGSIHRMRLFDSIVYIHSLVISQFVQVLPCRAACKEMMARICFAIPHAVARYKTWISW